MSMRVAFRCDASVQIGSGHVMRCLTLADALRERGAGTVFICRDHPGHLFDLLKSSGHQLIALPPADSQVATTVEESRLAHAAWLGASQSDDAGQVISALKSVGPVDWLVVDHYALDREWENALYSRATHIMVIDDLADREHDCDLLLDQNLGRDAADYGELTPAYCKTLIGPGYALLRSEFSELRQHGLEHHSTPQLRDLLVSMGGIDKDNVICEVLEALKGVRLPDACRIRVVTGAQAPWLAAVRAVAERMPRRCEVLVDVQDMARLMAQSDLAIGAAGGSSWERCCMGLPTLLVILANNQRPGAVAMEAAGVASLLGEATSVRQNLPDRLEALLSGGNLQWMRQRCLALLDGKGVDRVVKALKDAYD